MTANSQPDNDVAVRNALRRQVEDPEDHDLSLIEECLRLSPEQRLERLTNWVALIGSAKPIGHSASGGRH